MNRILLFPPPLQKIEANLALPLSKSICNRALIIHSLAQADKPFLSVSDCDDTRVMMEALTTKTDIIDIKACGTAMRFLTAYFTIGKGTHTITGTARMQERPIRVLVDALRKLGAEIAYAGNEGYPPLVITGKKLVNNKVSLPGNVSSQYISALLMIAPMLPEGLELTLVGPIVSKPYLDLTIRLMQYYGASVEWENERQIKVAGIPYVPKEYTVEADWSAASYWYEICSLSQVSDIRLSGLQRNSWQGDSKVAELFEALGVQTDYTEQGIRLRRSTRKIIKMEYDFTDQPDLAQTLVVSCAMNDIPFDFIGLESLRIKETDRIAALETEMRKLGYILRHAGDSRLYWKGEKCEPQTAPVIDTYHDHRMAMAFAPCCLRRGEIGINHPEVVSKSYPKYWEHLTASGFITEKR